PGPASAGTDARDAVGRKFYGDKISAYDTERGTGPSGPRWPSAPSFCAADARRVDGQLVEPQVERGLRRQRRHAIAVEVARPDGQSALRWARLRALGHVYIGELDVVAPDPQLLRSSQIDLDLEADPAI